jgi:ABC-type uncharacterized transport system ATPase subunit
MIPIVHRLSTVNKDDRTTMMRDGGVVEEVITKNLGAYGLKKGLMLMLLSSRISTPSRQSSRQSLD